MPEGKHEQYDEFPDATLGIIEICNLESAPSAFFAYEDAVELFGRIAVEEVAQSIGGSGMVAPAYDARGRKIALKRMIVPPWKPGQTHEEYNWLYTRKRDALHDEFVLLSRLSAFSQFPSAYAFGTANGTPALLMEWVDGVSLEQLLQSDDVTGKRCHFNPRDVAIVGESLFRVLTILESFGNGFVHRDLSPANIILRATSDNLDEQVRNRDLDICLIDFGSAFAGLPLADDRATASALRGTTPEYAPPEMLTDGLPGVENLRSSPKVDVYAACSILYELVTGDTPFRIYEETTVAPAHWKTTHAPIANAAPTASATELLMRLIYRGLAAEQEARPSPGAMYEALSRWLEIYAYFNVDETNDCFPEAVKPSLLLPDGKWEDAEGDRICSSDVESFNEQLEARLNAHTAWDAGENEQPGETVRERLSWWASHNFALYMCIMFAAFIVACLYCGYTWHETVVHWGW